jgi:hypothetical protein
MLNLTKGANESVRFFVDPGEPVWTNMGGA